MSWSLTGKPYKKNLLGRAVPVAVKLIAGKLKTSLLAFKITLSQCVPRYNWTFSNQINKDFISNRIDAQNSKAILCIKLSTMATMKVEISIPSSAKSNIENANF